MPDSNATQRDGRSTPSDRLAPGSPGPGCRGQDSRGGGLHRQRVRLRLLARRLPAIRDHLAPRPGQLGLVLLFASCGSLSGLPLAGTVVQRVGSGPRVILGAIRRWSRSVLVGLADNVAVARGRPLRDGSRDRDLGRLDERRGRGRRTPAGPGDHAPLPRRVQPRHRVRGRCRRRRGRASGVPARCTWRRVSFVCPGRDRGGLPVVPAGSPGRVRGGPGREEAPGVWAAWREPRTLVIGLLVLGWRLAEGAANDWVTVGFVDCRSATPPRRAASRSSSRP